MYISTVIVENFRAFKEKTVVHFNPGVTVLIGENDCGKSTVIDAIWYVLGITDQTWQRVELSDYYQENTQKEYKGTGTINFFQYDFQITMHIGSFIEWLCIS